MNSPFVLKKIVLQPTSLCNLNCRYCYLPDRDKSQNMRLEVVHRLVEDLGNLSDPVDLIWHGGEPLACGREYFSKLIEPFEALQKKRKLTHHIQTNATLINQEWCDLFKFHDVKVGVSIDGPKWANRDRVSWSGTETHSKTINGISFLKNNAIDFGAICVITNDNLKHAKDIYEFFTEIGCLRLGINIEEKENINVRPVPEGESVQSFWRSLFQAWKDKPTIAVREIAESMSWMQWICSSSKPNDFSIDIFPTIAWNGDIVCLSPEFLGTKDVLHQDFIVGNILQNNLDLIIENAIASQYVNDYITGITECKKRCDYYTFCGGGQASNKYFELGSTNGTETTYCRNHKQQLVEAILSCLIPS